MRNTKLKNTRLIRNGGIISQKRYRVMMVLNLMDANTVKKIDFSYVIADVSYWGYWQKSTQLFTAKFKMNKKPSRQRGSYKNVHNIYFRHFYCDFQMVKESRQQQILLDSMCDPFLYCRGNNQ
jgi:hypothetical protein